MPSLVRPSVAAWVLAGVMALGVGASVYQIPIQVDDALEVIEGVAARPSLAAAWSDGLHASRTSLRPLKQVRTTLLLDAGEAFGGRYHLAFRGYHALVVALLIGIFAYLARVQTWSDVAALAFALTVLTGMHTFSGLLREAYPVNHFLLIALHGLALFALARTRGGWWTDAAAVLLLVIASLTLESGVLLWPIAVAGYASGLRGISRPALYAMTASIIGYVLFRVLFMQVQSIQLGARATGFGADVISGAEQMARFGDTPIVLYAYNVTMAAVSVLLSQPIAGHWTVLDAWRRDDLSPVFLLEIGSSLAASMLIAWYLLRRRAASAGQGQGQGTGQGRAWREPVPLVFLTLLAANAMVSYAYAKAEIISLAGVFYALLAYVAMREWLRRPQYRGAAVVTAIVLTLLTSAWSIRAAGLHFKLRHAAFNARGEWAAVLPPGRRDAWPADPRVRALVSRLKEEAVLNRTIAPTTLSPAYQAWWGEP